MSIWTHIKGQFVITTKHGLTIERFENALGYIVKHDEECWETTLPLGSEGSLQWKTVNSLPDMDGNHTILINGDLRDYDNVNYIIRWFINICKCFPSVIEAEIAIECCCEISKLKWDGKSMKVEKFDE